MPKKVSNFVNEQKEVLNKLLEILGINENNKSFSLHELDDDKDKQDRIYELIPDIKRYFKTGSWTFLRNDKAQRKYMSIIRKIFKSLEINYNKYNKNISKNGDYICLTIYEIEI